MERMAAWWAGRSPRERALLSVMGGLIAVLAVWYGAVAPSLDWRAAAAERRSQAEVRLALFEAAAARMTPPAASDPAALQARAEPAAAAMGLQVGFAPGERGLDFTVASAATPALFGWIAALRATHGLEPLALTVTETAEGTLTAQGTLVQSSAR
jgi:type II secretory pathway component PulM